MDKPSILSFIVICNINHIKVSQAITVDQFCTMPGREIEHFTLPTQTLTTAIQNMSEYFCADVHTLLWHFLVQNSE
jgi:hypothetical protein